ncbi:MAG: glycosyltransferase [Lachnospiraceae bacterium]|nr:glycosyltransferase [Lachnospiraceae bacterium]
MANKRRIALFINSLCGGGAERVVSRISRELDKEYDLYIFLVEGKKIFYECAGTIIDLGCGSDRYIVNAMHAFAHINKTIRKYHIDCVISFLDVPNIINCVWNRNSKKMASIRAYYGMELCKTWREKTKFVLLKNCLKRADRVIPASQELNGEIIEYYHLDADRTSVIENPYDIMEIGRLSSEKIEEEISKFIQNHKTAVAVGRLGREKGYEELIDTFTQVYQKNKDSALIILGEGEIKEELEEMIKKRHLSGQVLLLGLRENPFAYMSKCQLYVSCTRHEGFPNSLVEAMACGLPVIHTDCKTGPREILTVPLKERNIRRALYAPYGILIPSYTRKQVSKKTMQKEFADAWIQLMSSDELREKYIQASRERAEYYSMDRCKKRFQEVIKDVLQCNDPVGSGILTKTDK